jgi:hypothetical protein
MATQEYANDELSRRGPDEKGPKALSTSSSSLHSAPSSSAPGNNVDRIPTFSIPEGFDSAPSHHHRPAGIHPDIEGVIDGIEATSLQQRRLSLFDYQPFSLPPSRVCYYPYLPIASIMNYRTWKSSLLLHNDVVVAG